MVYVGEYVGIGTQVARVTPLPDVWIVANFREVQLTHMQIGQGASITIDAFPGATFRGHMDSIGPVSGAETALLPPDNATGNFTHIVQRFPVKIVIEPVGVGLGCWLAVIFSLRRIMLLAIALFATSSAIAAMTHDLTLMILARSGMGLAAGVIIPLAIITELRTFPPTGRALAIGLYASAATMAPQAAASLDVWLVEHWGTPAIFWIAIPLGMIAFVCGYLGLWRERIRWLLFARADLRMVTLFSVGAILLGGGLSQGNRLHWSETPRPCSPSSLVQHSCSEHSGSGDAGSFTRF